MKPRSQKSQGKPNGKPNRGAGKVGHNQKPYFKNKNNQKAKGVSEKIKYVLWNGIHHTCFCIIFPGKAK